MKPTRIDPEKWENLPPQDLRRQGIYAYSRFIRKAGPLTAPSRTKTAQNVHASLERHTSPTEGLQPSSYDAVLLDNGDATALLREKCTSEQPAQATTYHNDVMSIHLLAATISLKICSADSNSEQVTIVPTMTPKMP